VYLTNKAILQNKEPTLKQHFQASAITLYRYELM